MLRFPRWGLNTETTRISNLIYREGMKLDEMEWKRPSMENLYERSVRYFAASRELERRQFLLLFHASASAMIDNSCTLDWRCRGLVSPLKSGTSVEAVWQQKIWNRYSDRLLLRLAKLAYPRFAWKNLLSARSKREQRFLITWMSVYPSTRLWIYSDDRLGSFRRLLLYNYRMLMANMNEKRIGYLCVW